MAGSVNIYTINNYFFIDILDDDDETVLNKLEALSKNVLVTSQVNGEVTTYFFEGFKEATPVGYALAKIRDADGIAYTAETWEAFYTANTGNFNSGGATPQYTEYFAVLNQSGDTEPPTPTVGVNTLGITPEMFDYVGMGAYKITKTGAFPLAKTFYSINGFPSDQLNYQAAITRVSDNDLYIYVYEDGSGTDGRLVNTVLSIKVYN